MLHLAIARQGERHGREGLFGGAQVGEVRAVEALGEKEGRSHRAVAQEPDGLREEGCVTEQGLS